MLFSPILQIRKYWGPERLKVLARSRSWKASSKMGCRLKLAYSLLPPESAMQESSASLSSPDPSWFHLGWSLTSHSCLESWDHGSVCARGSEQSVRETGTPALGMRGGVFIICNHSSHRTPATLIISWNVIWLYLMTAVHSYHINLILHKIWEIFPLNSSN